MINGMNVLGFTKVLLMALTCYFYLVLLIGFGG